MGRAGAACGAVGAYAAAPWSTTGCGAKAWWGRGLRLHHRLRVRHRLGLRLVGVRDRLGRVGLLRGVRLGRVGLLRGVRLRRVSLRLRCREGLRREAGLGCLLGRRRRRRARREGVALRHGALLVELHGVAAHAARARRGLSSVPGLRGLRAGRWGSNGWGSNGWGSHGLGPRGARGARGRRRLGGLVAPEGVRLRQRRRHRLHRRVDGGVALGRVLQRVERLAHVGEHLLAPREVTPLRALDAVQDAHRLRDDLGELEQHLGGIIGGLGRRQRARERLARALGQLSRVGHRCSSGSAW
jgi:hypothetical protein